MNLNRRKCYFYAILIRILAGLLFADSNDVPFFFRVANDILLGDASLYSKHTELEDNDAVNTGFRSVPFTKTHSYYVFAYPPLAYPIILFGPGLRRVFTAAPMDPSNPLHRLIFKLPLIGADIVLSLLFRPSGDSYSTYLSLHEAMVLFNPLLLFSGAVKGQFDCIPALFLLLSLRFHRKHSHFLSGVYAALSFLTKQYTVLSVPAIIVAAYRKGVTSSSSSSSPSSFFSFFREAQHEDEEPSKPSVDLLEAFNDRGIVNVVWFVLGVAAVTSPTLIFIVLTGRLLPMIEHALWYHWQRSPGGYSVTSLVWRLLVAVTPTGILPVVQALMGLCSGLLLVALAAAVLWKYLRRLSPPLSTSSSSQLTILPMTASASFSKSPVLNGMQQYKLLCGVVLLIFALFLLINKVVYLHYATVTLVVWLEGEVASHQIASSLVHSPPSRHDVYSVPARLTRIAWWFFVLLPLSVSLRLAHMTPQDVQVLLSDMWRVLLWGSCFLLMLVLAMLSASWHATQSVAASAISPSVVSVVDTYSTDVVKEVTSRPVLMATLLVSFVLHFFAECVLWKESMVESALLTAIIVVWVIGPLGKPLRCTIKDLLEMDVQS